MSSPAIKFIPKERIGKLQRERKRSTKTTNQKQNTRQKNFKSEWFGPASGKQKPKRKAKNEMRCAVQYVRFPGGPPPEY